MLVETLKKIIIETLNRKNTERLIKESVGANPRLLVDDIFFNNKHFEVNGYKIQLPNLIEFFYNNIFVPELKNGNISKLSEEERVDIITNPKRKNVKEFFISGVGDITIWNNGFSWIVYFKESTAYYKISGIETEKFVNMVMDLVHKQIEVLKNKKNVGVEPVSYEDQKKKEQEQASKNPVAAAPAHISNDRILEPPKPKKVTPTVPSEETVLPKSEPFKSKSSDDDLQKAKTHILRKRREE